MESHTPWDDLDAIASEVVLTSHGAQRLAERSLAPWAIDYVVGFGEAYQRTGVTMHVLRTCDIDPEHRRIEAVRRLVGTIVLTDHGNVITAYRRTDATRFVRRKPMHRRRRRGGQELRDTWGGWAA